MHRMLIEEERPVDRLCGQQAFFILLFIVGTSNFVFILKRNKGRNHLL